MVDFFRTFLPIYLAQFAFKRRTLRILEHLHWKKTDQVNLPSLKPLSGSFIYPIPPDYPSVPAHRWGVQNWIHEFQRLQRLGINTVILNGSVAETTTNHWFIFYPMSSEVRQRFHAVEHRHPDPPYHILSVPKIIDAAEHTQMQLHLGLFNVLGQWFSNPTAEFLEETLNQELAVVEDLVHLYGDRSCLQGWYISPEIMFILHGFLKKLDMAAFLVPLSRRLKELTPKAQIGISPGTSYYSWEEARIRNFWIQTLRHSKVDILYPQDSVGVLNVYPFQGLPIWKLYADITRTLNMHLWANCETFERQHFTLPYPLVTAPFDRLLWQLEVVSPFVEKIITWEAMYFVNPRGPPGSRQLWNRYCRYFRLNQSLE